MSQELEEKRAQFEALRIEVRDLENKERSEREYPKMMELVATYWKYRNSYSGSQEESDSWWLYRYVKEVTPDGFYVTMEFQIDMYGEIKLNANRKLLWETSRHLGTPSSAQEWDQAVAKVQDAVFTLAEE